MPARSRRRRPGGCRSSSSLALLAAAFAAYQFDLGERWFGSEHDAAVARPGHRAGRRTAAAGVDPAAARRSPRPWRRASAADGTAGWRRARSRALLAPLPRRPRPRPPRRRGGRRPRHRRGRLPAGRRAPRPASTTKLLTARRRAGRRSAPTTGSRTQRGARGPGKQRRVVLVGGGDPLPAPASRRRRTSRRTPRAPTCAPSPGRRPRRCATRASGGCALGYDDSLFTGPAVNPHWEPTTSPTTSSPDHRAVGRRGPAGRPASAGSPDPSLTAATSSPQELRAAGHPGRPASPTAPRGRRGATPLAEVESAPLSQIVEQVLESATTRPPRCCPPRRAGDRRARASFAGGVAGVRQALTELGVPRRRRRAGTTAAGCPATTCSTPATLLAVLRVGRRRRPAGAAAACSPGCRSPGFTGSLEYRFDDDRARGPRPGAGQDRAPCAAEQPRRHRHRPRRHVRGLRADGRPGAARSRRFAARGRPRRGRGRPRRLPLLGRSRSGRVGA